MDKKCFKCGITKNAVAFNKSNQKKDGRATYCKECCKEYRKKNVLKIKKYQKEWKRKNADWVRVSYVEWCKKNKDKISEYNKRYWHKIRYPRIKATPKLKLDRWVSRSIAATIKGEKWGRRWCELVGYSVEELTKHLEKQFDKKMKWTNYGSYWHIDHIKPKSLFRFISPEDKGFKECWALSNLQPLEKTANLIKFNHYEG